MNIGELGTGLGRLIAVVVLVLAIILMLIGKLPVWPGSLIGALAVARMV